MITRSLGFALLLLSLRLEGSTEDAANSKREFAYVTAPKYSTPTKVLFTCAMSASLIVSAVGNVLVIYIIIKNRSMKTTTNCLIMNLACCDLLISFITTPHFIKQLHVGKSWFGGAAGTATCKAFAFIACLSLNCSVLSLVAITVDRYFGVTRPLKYKTSPKLTLKLVIPVVWLISSLLAIKLALLSDIYYSDTGRPSCTYFVQSSHELSVSAFCILGTFFIIVILYSIIAYRLWRRKIPGEGSRAQHALVTRTARRVTTLMMCVVMAFIASWSPAFIVMSLAVYHPSSTEIFSTYPFLMAGTNWLMVNSSAINPCFYFIFIESFQQGMKNVCQSRCRCKFSTCLHRQESHSRTKLPKRCRNILNVRVQTEESGIELSRYKTTT